MLLAVKAKEGLHLPLWVMPKSSVWLLAKKGRAAWVVENAVRDLLARHRRPAGLRGNQFESAARREQREAVLAEVYDSVSNLRVLFDALEEGGVPHLCFTVELAAHHARDPSINVDGSRAAYLAPDALGLCLYYSLSLVPYVGDESGNDAYFEPNEEVLKFLVSSARTAIERSGAAGLLTPTVGAKAFGLNITEEQADG